VSSVTTLDDYSVEDGTRDNGLDQCPHCQQKFGGHDGSFGAVVDSNGRTFDNIYETDPNKGPWFCPDCFDELETNRKSAENVTLDAFAGGDSA